MGSCISLLRPTSRSHKPVNALAPLSALVPALASASDPESTPTPEPEPTLEPKPTTERAEPEPTPEPEPEPEKKPAGSKAELEPKPTPEPESEPTPVLAPATPSVSVPLPSPPHILPVTQTKSIEELCAALEKIERRDKAGCQQLLHDYIAATGTVPTDAIEKYCIWPEVREELIHAHVTSVGRLSWADLKCLWSDGRRRILRDYFKDLIATEEAEGSGKVPLQYIPHTGPGTEHVLSAEKADLDCSTLGVDGVLGELNQLLSTELTMDYAGLKAVLQDMMDQRFDLGTLYSWFRTAWRLQADEDILQAYEQLKGFGIEQEQFRQTCLEQGSISSPRTRYPRRIWDLYSNRVVPFHLTKKAPYWPVSHSWTQDMGSHSILTSINNLQWPVPFPVNASLLAIRNEFLNLGAAYAWVDVLCLRQSSADAEREALRLQEWRVDIPTIGSIYHSFGIKQILIYLNGLGFPISSTGWNDPRHWTKRAWTLQEVGQNEVQIAIAGVPASITDPLTAKNEDSGQTLREYLEPAYKISTVFDARVEIMGLIMREMYARFSTNPLDKIAGIGMLLKLESMPLYDPNRDLEEAWILCVAHMSPYLRGELLFGFVEPGDEAVKWHPSWAQLMAGVVGRPQPVHGYTECTLTADHHALYKGGWTRGQLRRTSTRKHAVAGEIQLGMLTIQKGDKQYEIGFTAHHMRPIPEEPFVLVLPAPISLLFTTTWLACRSSTTAPNALEKATVFYTSLRDVQMLIGEKVFESSQEWEFV